MPTAVIVKLYDPTTVGVPVKAPPRDNAIHVGKVDPLFTTYDDALPADKLIADMAAYDAAGTKSDPVTQEGVVDTS